MNVVQIIQLVVLVYSVLKEMQDEGAEPSADLVGGAIREILGLFGKTDVVDALVAVPNQLLVDIAKLLSGK